MVPRDHATPCGCIALGHYVLDQKESRCAGVRSITGTAGELARRPAGGGSIKHASDRVHRLGNTSDATMHRAVVLPGRPPRALCRIVSTYLHGMHACLRTVRAFWLLITTF